MLQEKEAKRILENEFEEVNSFKQNRKVWD